MGILDRFKKSTDKVENVEKKEQLPYSFSRRSNGNLQIDFHNDNYEESFRNGYDTTRLIIGKNPFDIEGHMVYDCAVSWYNENDAMMFNQEKGDFENIDAESYRGVLAEIDLQLLQTDPKYVNMVMMNLLKKSRVESYLKDGLEEKPEHPCGKYIGGVKEKETGYSKFFSKEVGEASHNSQLMVERRQKHREKIEEKRQKDIQNRENEIKRLQNEIDSMKKDGEEK